MLKLIRYHLPPFCKTCFSTSESFWHAKNNLVSRHQEVGLRQPPPQFGNFSHIIPFFFWPRPLQNQKEVETVGPTFLFSSLKQLDLNFWWLEPDLAQDGIISSQRAWMALMRPFKNWLHHLLCTVEESCKKIWRGKFHLKMCVFGYFVAFIFQ